jgi:hypothetical protein
MHKLVHQIKSSNSFHTKLPIHHPFNDLIYGYTITPSTLQVRQQIAFCFTPRSGSSVIFKYYLDKINLLDDAEKHFPEFIHDYRNQLFNRFVNYINFNPEIKLIKFITNPYKRAVSIWIVQTSHNWSFRNYLKNLVANNISHFCDNDKYHLLPQYIKGEEDYIYQYFKIDKGVVFNIHNKPYTFPIDFSNNYSSSHHIKKYTEPITSLFLGDVKLEDINKYVIGTTYNNFYDDEIKQLVEQYYYFDVFFYQYYTDIIMT